MEREDILKFTNSVILLSKLLTKMEDRFLAQKLHTKISDMISEFIEHKKRGYSSVAQVGFHNIKDVVKSDNIVQRSSVAQYYPKDLFNSINNLLDYLESLGYVKKADATPLLAAQRNLLKFKLHILKINRSEPVESGRISTEFLDRLKHGQETTPRDVAPTSDIVNSSLSTSRQPTKTSQPKLKSNSNKERIFSFIKRSPDVRTREVIDEFSALSDRTVKRNLKELTDEGFLKRKLDGGAVHYLAV